MHNISIKHNGEYVMQAVDTENNNEILDCIEEYMGPEFANCVRANFTTKSEALKDKLEEVQDELNEAIEEADWAKDELEETIGELKEKEKIMQSVLKGMEGLAEKLRDVKPTAKELVIIKKDVQEMTDTLKLEFE